MAIVTWVGQAQALPDYYQFTVSGSTAGTAYGFDVNGREVRYTAITGDTTTTVAAGIVQAASQMNDQRVRELTITQNAAAPTKIDVYGASDGRPITSVGVVTGVSSSHVTTGTGPNYLNNVLNYSTGGLPANTDTLEFSGLTPNDGPKYELDALSAVTLAQVNRNPDYQGVIGLPYTAPSGYTEFRNRFAQLKAAKHQLLFGNAGTDGTCCINGGAVASDVIAYGSGAQTGVYPVHLHNFPTGSSLEANACGVIVAPDAGQAATFDDDGVTALGGSVVSLTKRVTTAGTLVVDASSAVLDCVYATLTTRNASNVLAGPNASSSTATGVAVNIASGAVDWRSQSVPGAEVDIGTDATLTTKNALGPIPAFICRMYANATLDDGTGRITLPHITKLVQCSPEDVTIIKPEGIQCEWDVLV